MPGRIVLYGATGYIGGLTAQAMIASGARPVLAGRDQGRLNALAERLSRDPGDPDRCGNCLAPVTCWCRPRARS